MGAVIRNQSDLHGKVITLKRGGKDVRGVLLAQDGRFCSDEFAFRWSNASGVKIDLVSSDELSNIRKSLEKKSKSSNEEK